MQRTPLFECIPFCQRLRWVLEIDDMQLEAKANQLVVIAWTVEDNAKQVCITVQSLTFCQRLRGVLKIYNMQLEAKAYLLVITELVCKLEVKGHPAISPCCAFWKEVKLPAHNRTMRFT